MTSRQIKIALLEIRIKELEIESEVLREWIMNRDHHLRARVLDKKVDRLRVELENLQGVGA